MGFPFSGVFLGFSFFLWCFPRVFLFLLVFSLGFPFVFQGFSVGFACVFIGFPGLRWLLLFDMFCGVSIFSDVLFF